MLPDDQAENEVLVVEAPTESAPASPARDEHHDDFFGHGEPPTTIEEHLEAPPLPERSGEVDESTPEVPVKPPLPARNEETRSQSGEEVIEAHTRPPLPRRGGSDLSLPLPQAAEEVHRQEIGMYT